jgi:hypothetical protein
MATPSPDNITPRKFTRRQSAAIFWGGFLGGSATQIGADHYSKADPNLASLGLRVAPLLVGVTVMEAALSVRAHALGKIAGKMKEALPPPPFQHQLPQSKAELEHEMVDFGRSMASTFMGVAQRNPQLFRRDFAAHAVQKTARMFCLGAGSVLSFDFLKQITHRSQRSAR